MIITLSDLRFFQNILLKWFGDHGREFPWRNEPDPLKVLIAEIMLQRTRASQVKPVYVNLISKLDDVDSIILFRDHVISSFKTLGLPARGEKIVNTALRLKNNHNGRVPESREDLLLLPGVGEYAAEAVRVFAFGRRGTVIDSNVVRIVSRFFALKLEGELRRNRTLKEICGMISSRVSDPDIKRINWALLDFGALVCKPNPLCNHCPLNKRCNYFKEIVVDNT